MCRKSPSAVNYNRKSITLCPPPPKYQLTKLLTWKPKGTHQAKSMFGWDMREAMKTYARSPVHSLCALCPSPPKDQLTKTANLETQRGKSSQKHPGDMPKAIKTYARRPVDSLCKSILDAIIYNQKSN